MKKDSIHVKKWFFDLFENKQKSKINIICKSNTLDYSLTKEQLAQYYFSWGNEPYVLAQGIFSVYKKYIKIINHPIGTEAIQIDDSFFEILMARVYLFQMFNELYGVGEVAIGNVRFAVVPYSISILYCYTDGNPNCKSSFDMVKISNGEKSIDESLKWWFKELMVIVNQLLLKESRGAVLTEKIKEHDFINTIYHSKEMALFLESDKTKSIIGLFLKPREISLIDQRNNQNEAFN
jgi:hypothetical protein